MQRTKQYTVAEVEERLKSSVLDDESSRSLDESIDSALGSTRGSPALADGLCLAAARLVALTDVTAGQEMVLADRGFLTRMKHAFTGEDRKLKTTLADNRRALGRANIALMLNLARQEASNADALRRLSSAFEGLTRSHQQLAEAVKDLAADYIAFRDEIDRKVGDHERRLDFRDWRELVESGKKYPTAAGWLGAILALYDAVSYSPTTNELELLHVSFGRRFGLPWNGMTTRRKALMEAAQSISPDQLHWIHMALSSLVKRADSAPFLSALLDLIALRTAGHGDDERVMMAWLDACGVRGLDVDTTLRNDELMDTVYEEWKSIQSRSGKNGGSAHTADSSSQHTSDSRRPQHHSGDVAQELGAKVRDVYNMVRHRRSEHGSVGSSARILRMKNRIAYQPAAWWLKSANIKSYMPVCSGDEGVLGSEPPDPGTGWGTKRRGDSVDLAFESLARKLARADTANLQVGPYYFDLIEDRVLVITEKNAS